MSYSLREVSAMLGLPLSQVKAFARGFLPPERHALGGEPRFEFHDLIILRTAGALSAANIPQRKIQRVLEKLREQLPAGGTMSGVRITADGDRVLVSDGASVWNPESGQAIFDFSVDEILPKTVPLLHRAKKKEAQSADDWYMLGCELETSSVDQAKDAYQRAVGLDPMHSDAHVNLGRLLHEEGAPAAAEPHYRAALDADPANETAAYNLGVALEDLGRLNDAIRAYERALAIYPAYADAHFNLAGIYERRGDKASALRHLKEYRTLAPS
jgi:tetratricopeptide (TPR) repeat protein